MRTQNSIWLKAERRLKPILGHLISGFSTPILGIILSWMAVNQAGEGVWGAFTDWRIIATLSISVMSWGNSDWLLRIFSRNPAQMGEYFRLSLGSRAILLLIALPALLLSNLPAEISLMLFLWMVAGFLAQSLQVAVVFTRKFGAAVLSEVAMFVVAAAGILASGKNLNDVSLLQYFALGMVAKTLVLVPFFRKPYLAGEFPGLNFRYFYLALPFFLHHLAGMLQSRVDLYCVAWILQDDALTGRYQLFIGLVVQLQGISGFILLPFVKNLFRMQARQIIKISALLTGIGLVLTAIGLPLIRLVMIHAYHIELDWGYYGWAALLSIPMWIYAPFIYLLYKNEGQQKVVLVNFGSVLLNIGLNLFFIQTMALKGALMATAISQVFMLLMVGVYVWPILKKHQVENEKD